MEVEKQQLQVAQVAASEPYNQESIRPGCWSENLKCWAVESQNSAPVAESKAHSSCSRCKPLHGLLQL